MIRISCTNCKTILSIDDAFAGAVCRCQHCGMIQTVPAAARGNATTVSTSGQAIGGGKSLYQHTQTAESQTMGTGLDDLANVVVSSGLTSGRLRSNSDSARSALLLPALVGGGVLLIALVFVVIFLRTRNNTPAQQAYSGGSTGSTSITAGGVGNPTPALNTPNFCGMPLTGSTVIYLLDRGTATNVVLGDLKEVTIKSVKSLTADRKFAILFWSEHDDQPSGFPEKTTAYATDDSIKSAESAMRDVSGFGQPEINTALQQAIGLNPDEIVIATAKGLNMDNTWLDSVMSIRGNSTVKIDTFNLGRDVEIAPLKRLAEQTGGKYHDITQENLQLLAK